MSHPELEAELQRLERDWDQITTVPENPRSLLNVLGYSLSDQQRAEVYVNRLLGYFLDPDQPHGMGDDLLRSFLESLPDALEFEEDTYDLSGVTVETQVTIADEASGDRSGYVDLVIESPNEWFLLTELKFSAEENNVRGEGRSQTEFYEAASLVGGRDEGEYESGQYYLYVRPDGNDDALSGAFTNWSWTDISNDVLEPVLDQHAPRYPQRTVAQLRELIDDLTELTGMTQRERADQEKIDLYLEHFDVIEDVSSTFDEHWDDLNDEWATRLGQSLAERRAIETSGWEFKNQQVTDYEDATEVDPSFWALVETVSEDSGSAGEEWIFRAKDDDWAHLFKKGWWKSKDGLTDIRRRDPSREDIRLSLIHRFGNRQEAVGDGELHFYVRNCGSNDTEFRNRFNEVFDANEEDVRRALPDEAELTGKRRDKIEKTYRIRVGEHDTFAAAYVAAVEEAFLDFTVWNEELVEVLDLIYNQSLDVYRSSTE